ncbi:MAG TPA: hypothetical protein VK034_00460 [Enhygromyxa sp.]|nr:hypothetical protein [Enhygromyxa sp.]
MAQLLAPSHKRVRAARALGLRPRSGLLVLAGLALLVAALLELWPLAVRWLSARLEHAFVGLVLTDRAELAAGSGAGLLALLGLGVIAAVGVADRARARRALGVAPQVEPIPSWIAAALILLALGLSATISVGILAGAARSVDASSDALAYAWIAWVRHGLLGLAAAAVSVGVIERWISARRLWRALHQTPAQARREARATGKRAPRSA